VAPRPFTLLVAAPQQLAKAAAVAERMRGGDWETFTVPTEMPGKGVTYRVFLGRFESERAATAAQQTLRTKGFKGRPIVRALPYVIQVRDIGSADQVTGALQGLREGGYSPLLRRDDGPGGRHTLTVEAFASRAEAEPLADYLRAHGLWPQVIER
jgi:cell division septation protein DedD